MGDSVPKGTRGRISLTDTSLEPSISRIRPTTSRGNSSNGGSSSPEMLKLLVAATVWSRNLVEKGIRPSMARLTLARKIAAITLVEERSETLVPAQGMAQLRYTDLLRFITRVLSLVSVK